MRQTLTPAEFDLLFADRARAPGVVMRGIAKSGLTLDALPQPALQRDQSNLSVRAVVSTPLPDRSDDVVEPMGGDISDWSLNPVVMLEHGKHYHLPIAKGWDAQRVIHFSMYPDRVEATSFFTQSNEMSYQVFCLIMDDMLSATSMNFDPVPGSFSKRTSYEGRAGRPGLLIRKWKLLEYSWTAIGDNQQAVRIRKLLDFGRIGEDRLCPNICKSLAPFAAEIPVLGKGISIAKAKHTSDESKVLKLEAEAQAHRVAGKHEAACLADDAAYELRESIQKAKDVSGESRDKSGKWTKGSYTEAAKEAVKLSSKAVGSGSKSDHALAAQAHAALAEHPAASGEQRQQHASMAARHKQSQGNANPPKPEKRPSESTGKTSTGQPGRDHIADFHAAFNRVNEKGGKSNFVALHDLRQELPGIARDDFDKLARQLENDDEYVLDGGSGGGNNFSQGGRDKNVREGAIIPKGGMSAPLTHIKRIKKSFQLEKAHMSTDDKTGMSSIEKAKHDVSGESRDKTGKWTSGMAASKQSHRELKDRGYEYKGEKDSHSIYEKPADTGGKHLVKVGKNGAWNAMHGKNPHSGNSQSTLFRSLEAVHGPLEVNRNTEEYARGLDKLADDLENRAYKMGSDVESHNASLPRGGNGVILGEYKKVPTADIGSHLGSARSAREQARQIRANLKKSLQLEKAHMAQKPPGKKRDDDEEDEQDEARRDKGPPNPEDTETAPDRENDDDDSDYEDEHDEQGTRDMPGDDNSGDEQKRPYGQTAAKSVHGALQATCDGIDEHMKCLEQPEMKSHLEELRDRLKGHAKELKDKHDTIYQAGKDQGYIEKDMGGMGEADMSEGGAMTKSLRLARMQQLTPDLTTQLTGIVSELEAVLEAKPSALRTIAKSVVAKVERVVKRSRKTQAETKINMQKSVATVPTDGGLSGKVGEALVRFFDRADSVFQKLEDMTPRKPRQ